MCGSCHGKIEWLEPDDQLEECGIEAKDELLLADELAEWLGDVLSDDIFSEAPDPCPRMFEEVQNQISERPSNRVDDPHDD